jgi:hypothetical protein
MFGRSVYCLESDSDSSDDDLKVSNNIFNRMIIPESEPNRSWKYYLTCQFLCKKKLLLKKTIPQRIYNDNLDECD